MSSQNEDTGFQKYIANRLSPLSDTEFEVLRSLIWGCAYNEYFDPKQFSEAKYKSITLTLQERVGEPDSALFLDVAHLHGLVLKSPTPDATIVWPLFAEMEENKVEDGLYLWSVHEIYQMMKQELTDFEALDLSLIHI